MIFLFPSVICTRCTGFFCLAIIKGSPMIFYFIIEEPLFANLQKKFHTLSQALVGLKNISYWTILIGYM